ACVSGVPAQPASVIPNEDLDSDLPEEISPLVPGRIVVRFRSGVDPASVMKILREERLEPITRLRRTDTRVVRVRLGQEEAIVDRLNQRSDVEFAERDYLLHAAGLVPGDPLYSSAQWNLAKINMPDAWSLSVG